jgi:hypothetical protein
MSFAKSIDRVFGENWPEFDSTNKPWTRWWWFGSAVDRDNIKGLLTIYSDCGIGGVEITPIYGLVGNEEKELSYLSHDWVELLKFTIDEAHRIGLQVDMPTGTGWPFGGPQVAEDDALDKLVITRFNVASPDQISLDDIKGKLLEMTAYGVDGVVMRLDPADLVTGIVQSSIRTERNWEVYAASLVWGGRDVKRAAPGGEGKCINPFSRVSLNRYLYRFDEALRGVEKGSLRCHFHDSFEYLADFSEGFFTEFQIRRGYDLAEHLDVLGSDLLDVDRTIRVKTDYRQTIADLLLENFTQAWTDWAHKQGSMSRNQAHGSPGNLLDLYATQDIPETEIFGGVGNPIVNKFASSAAHLAGRSLCSSETCTWLGEHFNVTLAQCKDAIDGLFLSGINHVFYHGTPYSPLTDRWPGRLFYASTTFAPQDPLWRDLPILNAYIARVQSSLQAGVPDNDVLLYWPLSDLWMHRAEIYMLEINGNWLEGQPFNTISQTLWDSGYQFDFVSDRQLMAFAKDGTPKDYKAVVIPPCKFMPVETMEALNQIAESGVPVLYVDEFPSDVPGFANIEFRRQKLVELVGPIMRSTAATSSGDLLETIDECGARPERVTGTEGIHTIRRRFDGGCDRFVANRGLSSYDGWYPLPGKSTSVLLLDPMSGDVGKAECRSNKGVFEVRLQLEAGRSLIIRTLEVGFLDSAAPWRYVDAKLEIFAPILTWFVDFTDGGPYFPESCSVEQLISWTELRVPGADEFCGTVRYTASFDLPSTDTDRWLLDLGKVADSARVWLNGSPVAELIAGPFQVVVDHLRKQGNLIEVEVTNVAANRIRAMDLRGETWRVFREINFVNIQYQPFDASGWPIRKAGLLGPVTLTRVQSS